MIARVIILILLAILYLLTYLTSKTTTGREDTRAFLMILIHKALGWIFVIIAIIFLLDLILFLISKI